MSKCVEKIKHELCGSNALQVFKKDDGEYDGFCFACGKYEASPYKDKPPGYKPIVIKKTQEQIDAELEEINTYGVLSLPDRKLKAESLSYFGIKIGVSEQDGQTPVSHYYPYTREGKHIAYKVRIIEDKRMWIVGGFRDVDFFGWEQAKATGGKRLYITEGEVDCVSLYQIFKDQNKGTQYADFNPAVVSLPNGCGGAVNYITKKLKEIKEHFKEIVLVFDMDEPGKKAAEECIRLIPECVVAILPSKDVNDCLVEGRSKACYNAVQFNAKRPKNSRIVSSNDLHESAKEVAKFGLSYPWQWLTDKTRGMRFGETIYLGAGEKMGKSEIVNTIAAHCIKEHGLKVFLAKPEENNKKTYKLVAGKLMGKFFHDPTKEFDEDAYEEAGEILKDHLFMLNLYQHVGWESLKADIREAVSDGCKVVMIDPISNLTNGMESGAANVKLQEIAQELSAMALDLDIVIFIFCHLRNPDGGPPHERGGEVLSSQFAGSRAMARSCNYMFGLEGNRDPNLDADQRNVRHLVVLNDREYGEVGRFSMYWDRNTGLFNQMN